MSVLRRIHLDRRAEYYAALDQLVQRIKDALPVQEVYLFGSFATGDIHEGSDIDLLVVGDFAERFHERIFHVLQLNDENLPVEPLCYTRDELDRMREEENPFLSEAMRTAKRLA